ncbi:MAG: hypothetical protein LBC53_02785 [Spirochaetaceae bacterium]|jgi:hypothetical protein|nr:hypothetical protein [Spirochaetaceae bacterium]
MKLKTTAFFVVFLTTFFFTTCKEVGLPELTKRGDLDIQLTPPQNIDPKDLFANSNNAYKDAYPFTITVNPNGLYLQWHKRSDDVYVITLTGTVNAGIPSGLKLYSRINPEYVEGVMPQTEPPYYRYGHFPIQTWPSSSSSGYQPDPAFTITDPNYTPRDIDVSALNTAVGNRSTKYSAVTISGILEELDKKGNKRDLSKGVVVEQRNEALLLTADATTARGGSSEVWSFTINSYANPPIRTDYYTATTPLNFTEKDVYSDTYIQRGGLPFLIWDGAVNKKIYITISYLDGGKTKAEIDYSRVVFNSVQPQIFWFYSRYADDAANYPNQLPLYMPPLSDPNDPSGIKVTLAVLTAPSYTPPTETLPEPGPYPYILDQNKQNLKAKAGESGVYTATIGGNVGSTTINLLPVFYPETASNRLVEWEIEGTEDAFTSMENPDGSLSIFRSSNLTAPQTITVKATVFVPDKNGLSMTLIAEITLEPTP